MDKQTLITTLTPYGWERDRWGHLRKTTRSYNERGEHVRDLPLRIKLQARSARLEKRVMFTDGSQAWRRVASDYYGKIRLVPGGLQVGHLTLYLRA